MEIKTSSTIRSVHYDEPSGVLAVEFTSGDVYHYFNVPKYLYQELVKSSSKGRFLNENIRFNYRYQKIG